MTYRSFERCKNCDTLVWDTESDHKCTEFRVHPVDQPEDVVSVWVNTSVMGTHEYAAERWVEQRDADDDHAVAKGGGNEGIELLVYKGGEWDKHKVYRVTGEFRPFYRSVEV